MIIEECIRYIELIKHMRVCIDTLTCVGLEYKVFSVTVCFNLNLVSFVIEILVDPLRGPLEF